MDLTVWPTNQSVREEDIVVNTQYNITHMCQDIRTKVLASSFIAIYLVILVSNYRCNQNSNVEHEVKNNVAKTVKRVHDSGRKTFVSCRLGAMFSSFTGHHHLCRPHFSFRSNS